MPRNPRNESQIPGIEIITPTIFSAKNAARDHLDGRDDRSTISLLRDMAEAYLAVPGAETHQEFTMVTRGRKQPSVNPWKIDIMRVRKIREVAFETESGPKGIRLSEQSDAYRRPYLPGIRKLGNIAFEENDGPSIASFAGLTVLGRGSRGGLRSHWLHMDPWVEADPVPGLIDFGYVPVMAEMLEFPDDPTAITPFPAWMHKK